jgi:4a-hydroxytetrahydrobiopterin dehydratase
MSEIEPPHGWSQTADGLVRDFRFPDWASAFAFVGRVSTLAERHQHHPDVVLRWGFVRLTLITHDAAGGPRITERDTRLAREIDALSPAVA